MTNTASIPSNNTTINLYPNPNNGQFTLDFDQAISGHLVVTNSLGQIIHQEQIEAREQVSVQLSSTLSAGCYYIYIKDDTNHQFHQQTMLIR